MRFKILDIIGQVSGVRCQVSNIILAIGYWLLAVGSWQFSSVSFEFNMIFLPHVFFQRFVSPMSSRIFCMFQRKTKSDQKLLSSVSSSIAFGKEVGDVLVVVACGICV